MLKNALLVLALLYSAWVTIDKIIFIAEGAGAQQGYEIGLQQGIKVGKEEACMINPI